MFLLKVIVRMIKENTPKYPNYELNVSYYDYFESEGDNTYSLV